MSHLLNDLNEFQNRAVMAADFPVLVVAGPGTGKTLTIVRRIASLVQQGVRPGSILAVTFTNRAAREMRERAENLLGGDAARIFIGTFHLLGLKILRETLPGDRVLYNRNEQVKLLKSIFNVPAKKAEQIAGKISRIKNFIDVAGDEEQPLIAQYHTVLAGKSAVDFDDLIVKPIELFADCAVLKKYQNRFRHIIVDEYQDINPAQYRMLRLLSCAHNNLCVVGDADQAIYAFRGADIRNFLDFERDFSGTRRITLEENYRSTGTIVAASNFVIKHNRQRIEKAVSASREKGVPVSVISVPDERAEGEAILREIEARMGGTSRYHHYHACGVDSMAEGCSYIFSDFAVIYRTNAQARALEEVFAGSGIPYQIIGRGNAAQRAEAKETIAYMKALILQAEDAVPAGNDAQEEKLLTPADLFDPRADAVALMTMHMAKGLEFRTVFIAGCEEGLIPCTMMKDGADIEEERRLFYVGMTRAKDELFLLHARSRFLYGQRLAPSPSPFLEEIPGEFMARTSVPDRAGKQKEQDSQLGLF